MKSGHTHLFFRISLLLITVAKTADEITELEGLIRIKLVEAYLAAILKNRNSWTRVMVNSFMILFKT